MTERDLLEYIRSEHARNSSKEEIIAHLASSGYPSAEVEKAISDFDKDPSVGMTATSVLKKHHPFRLFVAILACFSALLGLLGVLINMGIVSLPIQDIPFDLPFGIDTGFIRPIATTPAYVPPVNPIPSQAAGRSSGQSSSAVGRSASSGISADDKAQIIDALLTQDNVLLSKNAGYVRNYLRVMAPSADQTKVGTMSDSAILVYATGLLGGTSTVGAGVLDSSQVIWQRTSGSTVAVSIPVSGGFVTRDSTELNGVWY